MRLRNNPNAQKQLNESKYLIDFFPYQVKKNTIIEMGMGKGEMITQLANKNSDVNFVGIEKFATVAQKAARRAKVLKLNNFFIICKDIKEISTLLTGKVDCLWLTFSDPWPKSKHEKRRLTYKTFLDEYKNILSENGVIKMKTDNDKLFEYSLESMKSYGMKIIHSTKDFHNSPLSKGNIMTGYEKKWSELGKNINFLEAKF